eukprot:CAMPEP_0172318254 /NCGR_PEP_ID=MMETSP1058-20130122/34327_1 /TAXON_ID=83371 /ORGANISM="Detonula confervacea, Strain CCMP 353" /LENGTH=144 /DNA_ID=CAMNT_0013033031 /DNA_START=23 /DNA_END=454 /DNA_ORIENTATION=-
MTDIKSNICHGCAFDEMDEEMETIYSHDNFICQAVKCALNEEPTTDARCISIESDTAATNTNTPQSSHIITDGHSDITNDYDIYPTILGTGNYGCVRECLHRDTCEMYAVKTIEKSKVFRLDHIQREIQLLRSIDHPSIMKLVD